jgi:hypothetical protein
LAFWQLKFFELIFLILDKNVKKNIVVASNVDAINHFYSNKLSSFEARSSQFIFHDLKILILKNQKKKKFDEILRKNIFKK